MNNLNSNSVSFFFQFSVRHLEKKEIDIHQGMGQIIGQAKQLYLTRNKYKEIKTIYSEFYK